MMTYQEQEPDVNKTATLTVRNIPLDVDAMITQQASRAGKSKSDFLKELLTQEFQDLIKNFSRTSPLVTLMDEELGKQFGVKIAEHWFENEMITANNLRYKALLKLVTHDDLQQIMMRNMPFLQRRARQVLHSHFAYIPRGLSLTFSLFNEIAGRDAKTIGQAFSEIFYLVGADKFYRDINAIRAEMKLEPVDGL
ncbi:hypothetical protein [Klebsiella variicola]|uniref:hypothetical protein n=2 Tax=Klebsiella/Raoultella group TaxID=2890311 RepID=UPI001CCB5BC9|nr:hypothetical protein [Klebsiella variicola]MDH8242763.1 hypothetical protein [Klebsiella pneumoniae]HCM5206223.1 hypothetical protein [Klebsiella quasipneumoniae subsp. similipneumoniae]MBZ6720346.1 hypothetical protein [Klebsiella variicola]MDU5052096.1 hypothetical protein [Klebsiella variicola]HCA5411530.1 hypothetical protein [Klebsiella variicola]